MTELSSDAVPPRPKSRRRLAILVTTGLLIVAAALVYSRPVGSGPAGPVVDRELFAREWSSRPVVLLGLGDSVTQGLGASPGKSYFLRLVENPADEFDDMRDINLSRVLPNLEAVNRSVSGMTSIECVVHQLPELEQYSEDVFGAVVITVGGNDVVHNYGRTPPREEAMYGARVAKIVEWKRSFDERLETIADRVRESFPGGCHIFIADI